MNYFGLFGLIIIPIILVMYLAFDVFLNFYQKSTQRKIRRTIQDAKKQIKTSNLTENSEYLIHTIDITTDKFWIAPTFRLLLRHFTWATRQALHSELHQREVSDDPKYIEEVIRIFDQTSEAVHHANLSNLALSIGDMYLLDARDRLPPNFVEMPPGSPEWVNKNLNRPIYLVGLILIKVIEKLTEGYLDQAKIIVSHALDYFPLIEDQEHLRLGILILKWTEDYLEQISEVRKAGNNLIWLTPEEAVIRILHQAEDACLSDDPRNVLKILTTSTDAYRTPKF